MSVLADAYFFVFLIQSLDFKIMDCEVLKLDSYLYTHVGSRKVNEDNADFYTVSEDKGFFVVCDGLGGHGKGEVASEIVVNSVLEKVKDADIADEGIMEESIIYAQNTLLQTQKDLNADNEMKTTVVALRIFDNKAQWAHVGDTRLYLFRKKKMLARTLDHSVPQMLVASGEIKEKHIRHHEDRNRLIRVMGSPWNSPKYEVSEFTDIQSGDAFLMCSDGFWELITEREMIKCLKKSKSCREWLERMGEIVLKNGKGQSMDNNTAIGVII